MKRERILGFDVARSISIIWIIAFYHVFPSANIPLNFSIKTITYSSLGIFTFLSAFLLTSRYRFDQKKEILQFYKKRLLRFYPLFLISSVILWIIDYNSLESTIKGILGISPFWKPHPTTMWYCAMLVSLYLITPFWANGGLKKQILKFFLTMSLITCLDIIFHKIVPRTYCYYPVFFSGILLAQYYYDKIIEIINNKYFSFCTSLLYFSLVVIQYFYINKILLIFASFIGIFALLSIYMWISDVVKKDLRCRKIFSILSYSSMCMYLFHREIQYILLKLIRPTEKITMFLYLGVIGLFLTVVIAFYIQKSYDNSLNNYLETSKIRNKK